MIGRFVPFDAELQQSDLKKVAVEDSDKLQQLLKKGLNSPLYFFWHHIVQSSMVRSRKRTIDEQTFSRISEGVSIQQEAFALLLLRNGLPYWINLALEDLELIEVTKPSKIALSFKKFHEMREAMKSALADNPSLLETLLRFAKPTLEWTDKKRNRLSQDGTLKKFKGWKKEGYKYFFQCSKYCFKDRGMQTWASTDASASFAKEACYQALVANRKRYRTDNNDGSGVYIDCSLVTSHPILPLYLF